MICNKCGKKNLVNSDFCVECGNRLKKGRDDLKIDNSEVGDDESDYNETMYVNTVNLNKFRKKSVDDKSVKKSVVKNQKENDQQGDIVYEESQDKYIKNYLVQNVILAILSCLSFASIFSLIFSIIGIIYSTQVENSLKGSNYENAKRSAKYARIFYKASIFSLIAWIIFMIILIANLMAKGYFDSFFV
jgi:hypothetical protein